MESIYFLAASETLKEEIEAVLHQASVAEQKNYIPTKVAVLDFPNRFEQGRPRRAGGPGHHYQHGAILRIVPGHPGYPRTLPALFDQRHPLYASSGREL